MDENKKYIHLVWGNTHFPVETGDSQSGNATRVINFIKKIDSYVKSLSDSIVKIKKQISAEKEIADSSNKYDGLIAQKQKDYDDIYKQIQCSTIMN